MNVGHIQCYQDRCTRSDGLHITFGGWLDLYQQPDHEVKYEHKEVIQLRMNVRRHSVIIRIDVHDLIGCILLLGVDKTFTSNQMAKWSTNIKRKYKWKWMWENIQLLSGSVTWSIVPDGLHVTFGGRLDLYQQPDGDGRFLLLSNETWMWDTFGINRTCEDVLIKSEVFWYPAL